MSLKWFLSSVLFLSCTVGDAMAAHLALRSLSATAGQEVDESPVAVYRVLGAGFGGANGLYVCNKGRAGEEDCAPLLPSRHHLPGYYPPEATSMLQPPRVSTWKLGLTNVIGKSGRRQVWGLICIASERGGNASATQLRTIYIAIPPLVPFTDGPSPLESALPSVSAAGLPHAGSWRVAAMA